MFRKKRKKRRGQLDFSGIIDMIMLIVLMPVLINVLTSVAGVSLPAEMTNVLNALTQLLPTLVIVNILEEFFRGVGGGILRTIFNVIEMLIVLPIALQLLSSLTGTTIPGLENITSVLMQILPLVLIADLLSSLFKKK